MGQLHICLVNWAFSLVHRSNEVKSSLKPVRLKFCFMAMYVERHAYPKCNGRNAVSYDLAIHENLSPNS